jgi:hypothetical protein
MRRLVHHELSPTPSLSFLVYALAAGPDGGVFHVWNMGDRGDRGSGQSTGLSDDAGLTLSAANRA